MVQLLGRRLPSTSSTRVSRRPPAQGPSHAWPSPGGSRTHRRRPSGTPPPTSRCSLPPASHESARGDDNHLLLSHVAAPRPDDCGACQSLSVEPTGSFRAQHKDNSASPQLSDSGQRATLLKRWDSHLSTARTSGDPGSHRQFRPGSPRVGWVDANRLVSIRGLGPITARPRWRGPCDAVTERYHRPTEAPAIPVPGESCTASRRSWPAGPAGAVARTSLLEWKLEDLPAGCQTPCHGASPAAPAPLAPRVRFATDSGTSRRTRPLPGRPEPRHVLSTAFSDPPAGGTRRQSRRGRFQVRLMKVAATGTHGRPSPRLFAMQVN
jgi:hypothetical protein